MAHLCGFRLFLFKSRRLSYTYIQQIWRYRWRYRFWNFDQETGAEMLLTDLKCKQAIPQDQQYKLTDGDGMYLLIMPGGGRHWRINYRYGGKRKTVALGSYPEISLKRAREKRLEVRQQLDAGLDPMEARRKEVLRQELAVKASFKAVALEWHENRSKTWTPHYSKQVLSTMDRYFFHDLGSRPINEITAHDLLETLKKIEKKNALDVVADARGYASQIFRYAIATRRAERDPAPDIRDAFRRHVPTPHSFLRSDQLPSFLKALRALDDDLVGRRGLELMLLTLTRTTEIRAAQWAEFDFEKKLWVIPSERMKMRREHVVPLSRQALKLLKKWKAVRDKLSPKEPYLFPQKGRRFPFMQENRMLLTVKDMGFSKLTTVHGMRSTGSTVLHETGKFDSLVIERQLAHIDTNAIRASYNHAIYLPEREKMMQWWADYLDTAAAKKEG